VTRRQIALRPRLAEAKLAIAELRSAEGRLLDTRDEILYRAWRLGELLAGLKEQVPRGGWQTWLRANLRELGSTDGAITENASRCIRFFEENPNPNVGNSRQKTFSIESIRKFMWHYVPAKERLQLEGDIPCKPGAHHLTFVNEFNRWHRQLRTGRVQGFDPEIFKREVAPVLCQIRDILGEEEFAKLTT